MLPYRDPYHNLVSMQATISQFELELTILKSRLETQELETQKANSKFEFSVSEQEKLKKKFEAERKAWADEKTTLLNRAEQAEATLAGIAAELSGLTRHVSQMVSPIFGKLLYKFLTSLHRSFPISISIAISSPDFVMQVPGVPFSTRTC